MNLSSLSDGIAVLTGSASGLGYAMASECASQGMDVVLSDLRPTALTSAVATLQALHPANTIVGFLCDVSKPTSVQNLLASVQTQFPHRPIRFLAANAGVLFPKATILSGSEAEWETTYRVNVLGLRTTVQLFTQVMLQQDGESCVEITASSAGVINGGTGPYGSSKHAALALAEGLQSELIQRRKANKVHVVVLCPAIVETALLQTSLKVAEATRDGLRGAVGSRIISMEARGEDASSIGAVQMFENTWSQGMSAEFCAKSVFECLASGKFYCILDNDLERDGFTLDLHEKIQTRCVAMLTGGRPKRGSKRVSKL